MVCGEYKSAAARYARLQKAAVCGMFFKGPDRPVLQLLRGLQAKGI
jgi:hypothetical protein